MIPEDTLVLRIYPFARLARDLQEVMSRSLLHARTLTARLQSTIYVPKS
jgi:hypothetical protein